MKKRKNEFMQTSTLKIFKSHNLEFFLLKET